MPYALSVDPSLLNAVFQFETLFFIIWIVQAQQEWNSFLAHFVLPRKVTHL